MIYEPQETEMEPVESPAEEAMEQGGGVTAQLAKALYSLNLAEDLDEEKLTEIGQFVKRGYDADKSSRAEWEQDYEKYLKQALQVVEAKTFPWKGASNIKFPIIAIAAMQFSARSYPTLVPSDRVVVRQKVIGYDPQGQKALRAEAVSMFMSYQLMEKMRRWEEDMDKLLLSLPIVGIVFKKTYWDTQRDMPCSDLVHAIDLVVNYWANDLESAERKTQEYHYNKRQIQEKINAGEFLDVELGVPSANLKARDDLTNTSAPSEDGPDTPYLILEQHTFYDVDGDGYPEPVVITIDHGTSQVLRITARWEADGVKVNEEGKLVRIEPCEFYTKFGMFPNPDGGFYDVGFGRVLGPLNDSVDSIINQLVDAGTLNNLQGGWISKGLKIKQGDAPFRPGEWRQVNSSLDDLRKGVLPHQYKEPSAVLFQLLNMLVQSSKELASVAEIMTGKLPGQNTPAYTTREAVDQGMKVFTAVYKRVFRALTCEFRKLHRLNKLYISPETVQSILDSPTPIDLRQIPDDDIVPAADPQGTSSAAKAQRAQQFAQLIQMGAINRGAALKKILEYEEIPLTPELLAPPEPDPKAQAQMKAQEQQAQQEAKRLLSEMQMKQQEHQLRMREMEMEMGFKRKELELKIQEAQLKLQVAQQQAGMKVQMAQIDMQVSQAQSQQQLQQNEMQHQQDLQHQQDQHAIAGQQSDESHQMKMKQQKDMNAAKGSAGKPK